MLNQIGVNGHHCKLW